MRTDVLSITEFLCVYYYNVLHLHKGYQMNNRDQQITVVSQRLRRELNDSSTTLQRRCEILQQWQQFLNLQNKNSHI